MGQRPGGPENSPQMAHLASLLGGIHRVAHHFSCPDEYAYEDTDMIKGQLNQSKG